VNSAGLWTVLDCEQCWTVNSAGLWTVLDSEQCWTLNSTGLWTVLDCEQCWIVNSTGLWTVLDCEQCWIVNSAGLWTVLDCEQCWTVNSTGLWTVLDSEQCWTLNSTGLWSVLDCVLDCEQYWTVNSPVLFTTAYDIIKSTILRSWWYHMQLFHCLYCKVYVVVVVTCRLIPRQASWESGWSKIKWHKGQEERRLLVMNQRHQLEQLYSCVTVSTVRETFSVSYISQVTSSIVYKVGNRK